MTTVKELIEKLQEVENKELHVFVWEGYMKTPITTKFEIKHIKEDQTTNPFILLEGREK